MTKRIWAGLLALGMALTALAGPVSNSLLALLLLLTARGEFLRAVTTGSFSGTWFSFLVDTASLSVGLGLFNLVPIPPLDGSKVLAVLLPDRAYNWLMRYERYGMALLMLLLLTGVLDVPLEFLRDGLLNGLEAIGTWPVRLLLALR